MGKRTSKHPQEFRDELVVLVRSGRSLASLAREFKVSEPTLRKWARQAAVDRGDAPGTTSAESEELRRLRREVERLREERDILKKATAWFAQESVKKKFSDS
jgi:transposase